MRLIDANALIKEFEKLGYTYRVTSIIDNAPTVEGEILTEEAYSDLCLRASRERPQGEWKVFMVGREGEKIINITYHCSECGRSIVYTPNSTDPDETTFLSKYPFCHCGADMRGGEEE